MSVKLDRVLGDKTAKQFEPLKLRTVGDLMHHLPRRYYSGTELSDLSVLQPDEEAAVMAVVLHARAYNLPGASYRVGQKPRLEVVVTDHRGELTVTFFGQPRLIKYWERQLVPGARGIFAGKVKEFNNKLQLAHPDFVIIDEEGQMTGGAKRNAALANASQQALVGLYPMTGKLRTWTIAESAATRPRVTGRHRGPAARVDPARGRPRRPAERVRRVAPAAGQGRPSRAVGNGCASTRRSPCS